MKNVTISLKESVARFAKTYAAKSNLSLSAFLSKYLEGLMNRELGKAQALKSYLSAETYVNSKGKRFKRDELYDRPVLRRH